MMVTKTSKYPSMKLSTIAPSKIAEGQVDPHILMSIKNLAMGQKPNTFSLIVMARMLELLKLGHFYKEPNFFEVNVSTPKSVLDELRNMPVQDLSKLAARLDSLMQMKDKDELYTYANPSQEYATWLKWVTSKEAND